MNMDARNRKSNNCKKQTSMLRTIISECKLARYWTQKTNMNSKGKQINEY